jgi:serine/threonine protein kinase
VTDTVKTEIPDNPPPSPQSIRLPSRGETILHRGRTYVLNDQIGEGYFGKVFECSDHWANDLVAKVLVPKNPEHGEARTQWLGELRNLVALRHPTITFAYDAFEYEGAFYLILERCGGALHDLFAIEDFHGDLWLPTIARDVLQALEFIHNAGYVHKDIHPGNILVAWTRDRMLPDKEHVVSFKVGDLGITRLQNEIDVFNTMLAQWMLPPEAIAPSEYGVIGHTVDIYHVGLVFLSVLLGKVPRFSQEEILDGRPRQIAESLKSPYSPAIARALRRHSQARQQSAAELWTELVQAMPDNMRPL